MVPQTSLRGDPGPGDLSVQPVGHPEQSTLPKCPDSCATETVTRCTRVVYAVVILLAAAENRHGHGNAQ